MNYVARLQIATRGDHRVPDGTASNLATLFVNPRPAFRVNRAICARAFVETPMCCGDDCFSVLFSNVARHETEDCFPNFDFDRHSVTIQ